MPFWHEADFEVKMLKAPQCRITFGSCDVRKVHGVVARSTVRSQNGKNAPFNSRSTLEVEMFEKCMGLWPEAPFEVKMVKARHSLLGALLEVEMLKKYTALWREAHFQVKMCKTTPVRIFLEVSDVQKVHAAVARSTCRS